MFLVKEGNSPVLKRCGFPIVVVRYPYNRKIHPRVKYDNQFATYMLIEEYSGFAPKVCIFSSQCAKSKFSSKSKAQDETPRA